MVIIREMRGRHSMVSHTTNARLSQLSSVNVANIFSIATRMKLHLTGDKVSYWDKKEGEGQVMRVQALEKWWRQAFHQVRVECKVTDEGERTTSYGRRHGGAIFWQNEMQDSLLLCQLVHVCVSSYRALTASYFHNVTYSPKPCRTLRIFWNGRLKKNKRIIPVYLA